MSLINDALKRAKEAHRQTPVPPPDLPFRPVEPSQQRARRGLGFLVPVALGLIALLALMLVWQLAQKGGAPASTEAAARTTRDSGMARQESPAPSAAPAPIATPVVPSQPPTPAAVATPPPVVETSAGTTNPVVAEARDAQPTNSVPEAAPEPSKAAPLRLQAILLSPKRPSAVISGKTVFVGDKVGDLRVMAIDQESATLAGTGGTKVLNLSQ
jgi:hypothetical protein